MNKPTDKQIEAAARAIVASKSPELANGEWWSKNVQHFREMCAEFPAYAASHSLVTDAFRHAETALSAALAVEAGTVQEPLVWIYEDELPLVYPYNALFPYSKVDGVRMFPIYGPALTTSPASSVTCERCQGNGEIVTDWERYKHPHERDKGDEAVAECPDCNGTGYPDAEEEN